MAHVSQKNLEYHITKIRTLSNVKVIQCSKILKVWPTGYLLFKFHNAITNKKCQDIVKRKWSQTWRIFSNFQIKNVTVTFCQGHARSHHFEDLSIGYLKANFHHFPTNKQCLKDCQKWSKIAIFLLLSKGCDLDFIQGHLLSHCFEGIPPRLPLGHVL